MERARGLELSNGGVALTVHRAASSQPGQVLRALAAEAPPDGVALAQRVRNKRSEKHHWCLGEDLLSLDYAAASLDPEGAHATLRDLARRCA